MTIEPGDRVRTETGQTGEVVILNDDRTLGYLRLDDEQGAILVRCRVDSLTKIDDAPA